MGDEAIERDQEARLEWEVQPLTGGELALLVLLRDAGGAPALFCEHLAVVELIEELTGVGHGETR